MSSTQEKLENILDRLAVRMYDEGQLDKPSLMGGQVAIVNIQKAKESILALLVEAELKGFMVAFDCYDYERLREYKATLEGKLKTLQGKETTK